MISANWSISFQRGVIEMNTKDHKKNTYACKNGIRRFIDLKPIYIHMMHAKRSKPNKRNVHLLGTYYTHMLKHLKEQENESFVPEVIAYLLAVSKITFGKKMI